MSEFRYWHRNRLLKLVKLLRSKKVANHFNLDNWANRELGELTSKKVSCGTEACAVGWACTIPSFRKAGLKLVGLTNDLIQPTFRHSQGMTAAANFFGMTYEEANHLFHPDGYENRWDNPVTPKEVANKIVNFVKVKSETSLA